VKRTAKWQRHITIAELRHLREQGAPSLVRFKKLRVAQKGMKAQWRERAVDLPTSVIEPCWDCRMIEGKLKQAGVIE